MESPESTLQESVIPPNEGIATPENQSFEQQVNDIVNQMTVDDKGNYHLPDGEYSPELRFAANAERRRRSTESALSKTRHKLKVSETVTQKFKDKLAEKPQLSLTTEQEKELDDLKFANPEAWRDKVNELEASASATLSEELSNFETETSQQAELELRIGILEEFNASHDIQITDEVIEQHVPSRFVKALEKGKMSFPKFLEEVYDYLKTSKVIGSERAMSKPNLGDGSGSKDVPGSAQAAQDSLNYSKVTF